MVGKYTVVSGSDSKLLACISSVGKSSVRRSHILKYFAPWRYTFSLPPGRLTVHMLVENY